MEDGEAVVIDIIYFRYTAELRHDSKRATTHPKIVILAIGASVVVISHLVCE
jgi:hypothetical protein